MTEKGSYSSLFFAFIGGALTGAAVAYLTAPRSGMESRAQLADLARRQKEKLGRIPQAVRDKISQQKEKVDDLLASERIETH